MKRRRIVEMATVLDLLHVMVGSEIPVLGAFEVAVGEADSRAMRLALTQVVEDLRCGASVHEALSMHPGCFPAGVARLFSTGDGFDVAIGRAVELSGLLADRSAPDLASFTLGLAVALECGLSLEEALLVAADLPYSRQLQRIVASFPKGVALGYTLSEVMARFPSYCPAPARHLIAACEGGLPGLAKTLREVTGALRRGAIRPRRS